MWIFGGPLAELRNRVRAERRLESCFGRDR